MYILYTITVYYRDVVVVVALKVSMMMLGLGLTSYATISSLRHYATIGYYVTLLPQDIHLSVRKLQSGR